MFNFRKTVLPNFRIFTLLCRCFTSFTFYCIKSTINQFKRLLLIEKAQVRIKPGKSSTRPNEARRKNIHASWHVSDVKCFSFVYHANMDRLYNTHHKNTKLDTSCNLWPHWAITTGELLCSLREYKRKVSFQRTKRSIAQFGNRTESRQPWGCQPVLLSVELHRRLLGY